MLRALVTTVIAAVGILGIAQAHSDKPKDATEKKAHGKHAAKGDAKKENGKEKHDKEKHDKEKHGSDHGKSERKH